MSKLLGLSEDDLELSMGMSGDFEQAVWSPHPPPPSPAPLARAPIRRLAYANLHWHALHARTHAQKCE